MYDTVVCRASENGIHEIWNTNVSKVIGNVIHLVNSYVAAYKGFNDYNKFFNDDKWSGDKELILQNCTPEPEVEKNMNVLIASILRNIFVILNDSTPSSSEEMKIFVNSLDKAKSNMRAIQNGFLYFKFFHDDPSKQQRMKKFLLLVLKDFKQLELDVHKEV